VFGVSRFKDKVAVVAGAEHALGAALCQRLAGFGAVVVALGWDGEGLHHLAKLAPTRIEPLTLRNGRRDVYQLLQEAWASEPIDLYIDAAPLCPEDAKSAPRPDFLRSAGVAAALAAGLRAGAARAVIAVPEAPHHPPRPEEQARTAGYGVLVERFNTDCAPARFMGLRVPGPPFDWTDAACVSAGDAILMLCHPVSRGLRSGVVIDWAA